jgi:hypothetical protein
VAAAVAVLAVLVGVGVAVASPGSDVAPMAKAPAPEVAPAAPAAPLTQQAPPSTQNAAPPSTPALSTPALSTPAPGTEAAPAPQGSHDGQPSRSDMERFVRSYYGLLPGDTDQAWKMLGDKARSESKGTSSFSSFYGSLRKVSFAQGPTAVDDTTVEASLMFETKDGRTSGPERYQFVVQPGDGGDLQISSFRRY